MAVYEQTTLLRCKDENGNEYLLYPITRLDCVDGAEDLVHYDKDQELTAVQKAQFLKNIGGLCAPVSAQANQFLKVSAVDDNGNVTAVESIDIESGSSGGSIADSITWDKVTGRPFHNERITEETYPKQTTGTFAYVSNVGSYLKSGMGMFTLDVDKTYEIVWDGVTYSHVAFEFIFNGYKAICLGNKDSLPGSGNEVVEPFFIYYIPDNNYSAFAAVDGSTAETHEIGVTKIISEGEYINPSALPLSVQSDWNQTDENDPAYIKNKPFGEESTLITLLSPTEFGPFMYDSFYEAYVYQDLDPQSLTVGNTYRVTWDGVPYNCVAQDASFLMDGAMFLGDATSFGLTGNGETFIIGVVHGYTLYIALTDTADGATHTAAIEEVVTLVHKIDPKYLPDNIGGGSSGSALPEVTTEDYGKFLRVTDEGIWAAVSIPNAEGVGF